MQNGVTYLNLTNKSDKSFVILDKDGKELFSMPRSDSETYKIVNRVDDTFMVYKNVANMKENVSSIYLIDKNGKQIGDVLVEGDVNSIGGIVLSGFSGPIIVNDPEQNQGFKVDPATGAMSPYNPAVDIESKIAWYGGDYKWAEVKYDENGDLVVESCENIKVPDGLDISSAYTSGDYYFYVIRGADGNTYYGLADANGEFLYEPLSLGYAIVFSYSGVDFLADGYVMFEDNRILTPDGEFLTQDMLKDLPKDFEFPKTYVYASTFIRGGFISNYMYYYLAEDSYWDGKHGYVSLDGKTVITDLVVKLEDIG